MNTTPATVPAWAAPGSTVLATWEEHRPRSATDMTLNHHLGLSRHTVLRHTPTMLVLDDGRRFNHDLTQVGMGLQKVRLVDPASEEGQQLMARARVQLLHNKAAKAAKVFAAEPSAANADALTAALTAAREAGAFTS